MSSRRAGRQTRSRSNDDRRGHAGTASTPTGTVSFGSSGPGSFSASQCALSRSGASAGCSVAYTAAASGVPTRNDTITATYGGDALHAVSSATTAVTVRPTSKADCRQGGWQNYGFQNQGQCFQFVSGALGPARRRRARPTVRTEAGGTSASGNQGQCVQVVVPEPPRS
jgi:hypothetical protein